MSLTKRKRKCDAKKRFKSEWANETNSKSKFAYHQLNSKTYDMQMHVKTFVVILIRLRYIFQCFNVFSVATLFLCSSFSFCSSMYLLVSQEIYSFPLFRVTKNICLYWIDKRAKKQWNKLEINQQTKSRKNSENKRNRKQWETSNEIVCRVLRATEMDAKHFSLIQRQVARQQNQYSKKQITNIQQNVGNDEANERLCDRSVRFSSRKNERK